MTTMLSLKKLELILKHLEPILKQEDEELRRDMGDEYTKADKDRLTKMVAELEGKIYKEFTRHRTEAIKRVNGQIQKDEVGLKASKVLALVSAELKLDEWGHHNAMKNLFNQFFQNNMSTLTGIHMDLVDKEVGFNQFSPRTTRWIEDWSSDLADLMKLGSDEGIKTTLQWGLDNGLGIKEIEQGLQDHYGFSRHRARATAITETLTANSASQYEAYVQSPAVTEKKWKHSGARKNNPRKWHQSYSGTKVKVDDDFELLGEKGKYPRATTFSAKNRVRCHCAMGPVTDPTILELPPEHKQIMHDVKQEIEKKTVTGRDEFINLRGTKNARNYEREFYEAAIDFYKKKGVTNQDYPLTVVQMREGWMGSSVHDISGRVQDYVNRSRNLAMEALSSEQLEGWEESAVEFIKDHTYQQLRDKGITHIKIYRGIKVRDEELPNWMPKNVVDFTVGGRALSSWTMDYDIAEEFAHGKGRRGAIFEAEIPIESVWGMFDFRKETEIVTIGEVPNVRFNFIGDHVYELYKDKGIDIDVALDEIKRAKEYEKKVANTAKDIGQKDVDNTDWDAIWADFENGKDVKKHLVTKTEKPEVIVLPDEAEEWLKPKTQQDKKKVKRLFSKLKK